MAATWTEEQGLRLELAVEVLSGEIGRRNRAIRALAASDTRERARLEGERTAIIHLSNRLCVDDGRRIDAILDRDIDEALRDEEPPLRRAM